MSRTPTPSDDDNYDYFCDLPSCNATTVYEPIEVDDYPDEPPPEWFSVLVKQHGVQRSGLVYCSHGHMVEGLDEHLPEPEDYPSPEQDGWLSTLGCGLALLAVVVVFVLGLISALVLLVGVAGWIGGRF